MFLNNFRSLISEVRKGACPDVEVLFTKHILKAAVDHIHKYMGVNVVARGHYARTVTANETHISADLLGKFMSLLRACAKFTLVEKNSVHFICVEYAIGVKH